MLSQVVELIESKNRFMITSHVRPDGDSLGSSLGLYWVLRSLGKDVKVFMRDPVPHSYCRVPGADEVETGARIPESLDAVFVIECSDASRPGLENLREQYLVNIDHHSTTVLFGDVNWIDPTASAVGEMIYNLTKALGVAITKEIAECVYAAILTDTGSFHFSNTSERTFKVASELVRKGADPAHISQAIFYSYSFSKIKLLGMVLTTLRRDPTGRIAWLTMPAELMAAAGASDEDSDGIVNYPLSLEEVDVVAFFKETEEGVYRTSLRSKGKANVAKVAESYGGGGHHNAAGCTLRGDFEPLRVEMISRLQAALDHHSSRA